VRSVKTRGLSISVIIPTFNRRAKLERCLQSLSTQSLPREKFEAIIVDDGSTDDTQAFLAALNLPIHISSFVQKNQGAGAARRLAVEHARGEYLLLMDDDAVMEPNLLEEHLRVQRAHQGILAVVGSFDYQAAARKRALTHFLSVDRFFYPQCSMQAGLQDCANTFVGCNLSVNRKAVLACGSFDPAIRLAEDADLGARMEARGCRLLYHPQARAWHDHLSVTIDDVVRRSKSYGPPLLYLLRKYPGRKMWTPWGDLTGATTTAGLEPFLTGLRGRRADIEEAVRSLKQFDTVDFEPFFAIPTQQGTMADTITDLFRLSIPGVYGYYRLESMCAAWGMESIPVSQAASAGVHA
jgi:glycosyltransferase involved in cell wall biosynthesis